MRRLKSLIPAVIVTVAVVTAGLAWHTQTSFNATLEREFQTVLAVNKTRSSNIATANLDRLPDRYLQLAAAAPPMLPGIIGTLAKGDRLTISSTDGALRLLEVASVRPLPLPPGRVSSRQHRPIMLVTLAVVGDSAAGKMHVLVEQAGPNLPFAKPAEQPL